MGSCQRRSEAFEVIADDQSWLLAANADRRGSRNEDKKLRERKKAKGTRRKGRKWIENDTYRLY